MNQIIVVNDKMQKNYSYCLTEKEGENFSDDFKPELSPEQMLELGVFGGKYLCDCQKEFPLSWFEKAKLSPSYYDPLINFYRVRASQPLRVWQEKGWIFKEDPRGWFQWYCRYYYGRRAPFDLYQIKRWKAMTRHIAQVKKNCFPCDLGCRPKQRQALLHWAYDSRKM